MTSKLLSKKKGIKYLNDTYVKNPDWVYAGGDFLQHDNYWKLFKKDYDWGNWHPSFKSECVCGQDIEKNCWLYNKKTNRFQIIGSDCIRKFQFKKICSICSATHNNRKINLCNACRPSIKKKKLCQICGEEHRNIKNNICNSCREGRCVDCGRDIDEKYPKCYKCYINKKNKKIKSYSNCDFCNGTGTMYMCDGVWGNCFCA